MRQTRRLNDNLLLPGLLGYRVKKRHLTGIGTGIAKGTFPLLKIDTGKTATGFDYDIFSTGRATGTTPTTLVIELLFTDNPG